MIPAELHKYKAYIFDLDNTLYPEKDYLYQIYYLIGIYLAERENVDAKAITDFLIKEFENAGRRSLFNKVLQEFKLNMEYLPDLLEIQRKAKLPLKLYLYRDVYEVLKKIEETSASLFILTNGNTDQQLNKIRQLEWLGLDKRIKVYFAAEYAPKPAPDAVVHILTTQNFQREEIIFIGDSIEDESCAKSSGVDFIHISEIIENYQ